MAFDFITYMKTVSTKLKAIQHVEYDDEKKHFYRCSSLSDMEELLQNLSNVKFPALIVHDTVEGTLLDNGGAGFLDDGNFFFYIITNVAILDFDEKEKAIKDCRSIMKKIISKMRKDHTADFKNTFPRTGLKYLDTNSFNYFSVGPIGDNCYGIYCSFSMLEPDEIIYSDDDWL